ncbi:MAG TPA: bifunctional diaminohydroxyphosphoribosylaminopyrimidine deaminase/5-amino-6-(5-phosphoribosylamino)uracil reductase RibD [Blastocatellia bacterium]|nr:bifunctional diaminohydroxyphosphoribosylaminopyrimidine deaminase/5-amino-6-(5-phosphoribosylamino)uracil reductase RibD [Blastocatellia bacterium]
MPTFTEIDQEMMQRALELAAQGVGQVSPGPLVGTVIVDANGEIAGEGFYLYDQIKHAETVALERAGDKARGGTAYVSLEPHAHQGRTPPCTDTLIKAGIKRVVAPIEDPNPKVSGRGFAHLREAGVEVQTGVMTEEASRLNESYIHFMRTGRPFVHLKMAASLDGKVATVNGDSRWITGEQARARVHELRHRSDAIMIGGRTARSDDPLLTDRSGQKRRRPLVRVVIEQYLRISPESQLAQTTDAGPVLIFACDDPDPDELNSLQSRGVEVVAQGSALDLASVLEELGQRSIQSVLVEGGPFLAGLMLEAGLVNKVTFFVAPMIIGGQDAPSAIGGAGAEKIADALQLAQVEVSQHGRDVEITGYPAGYAGVSPASSTGAENALDKQARRLRTE